VGAMTAVSTHPITNLFLQRELPQRGFAKKGDADLGDYAKSPFAASLLPRHDGSGWPSAS
jgi:hypothetical protein